VSPSDVRNSLFLCTSCGPAFEQHHIEILADGTLEYQENWLHSLSELRAKKYRALRAVPWAHHINQHKQYPTSSLLRPRRLFPVAASKEARECRAYLKYAVPNAQMPPEEGKTGTEGEEEEEEQATKRRKTKGKGSGGRREQVSHTSNFGVTTAAHQ
jgi:hypothetical protein